MALMIPEVDSFVRRTVRSYCSAISMHSGKGSIPRAMMKAGISWRNRASKRARRSSLEMPSAGTLDGFDAAAAAEQLDTVLAQRERYAAVLEKNVSALEQRERENLSFLELLPDF